MTAQEHAERIARALEAGPTPGPWVAHFEEAYFVTGPDLGRVAMMMNLKGAHGSGGRRSGNESAANNKLIAAANPAALAALLSERAEMAARVRELEGALRGLLTRDERNRCQHEETHRGGFIWEICNSCGAKWADDEGGKPEWADPPEWDAARAALKGQP